MPTETRNPFSVGERVSFQPDARTISWSYSGFDLFRLSSGDIGTVTRIRDKVYLYLDDERGGYHWQCFKVAE